MSSVHTKMTLGPALDTRWGENTPIRVALGNRCVRFSKQDRVSEGELHGSGARGEFSSSAPSL